MRAVSIHAATLRRMAARFVLAYLSASLAATVVLFEGGSWHADAVFTTFPEYLVVVPVVPALLVVGILFIREPVFLVGAGVFAAVFASVWIAREAVLSRRASKRGRDPQ